MGMPRTLMDVLKFAATELDGTSEGEKARELLKELDEIEAREKKDPDDYDFDAAKESLDKIISDGREESCDCNSCIRMAQQLSTLSKEDLIIFGQVSSHSASEAYSAHKEGVMLVDAARVSMEKLMGEVAKLKKELEFERAKTKATSPALSPRSCTDDPPEDDRPVIIVQEDSTILGIGNYLNSMGVWGVAALPSDPPKDESRLLWVDIPEIMAMT